MGLTSTTGPAKSGWLHGCSKGDTESGKLHLRDVSGQTEKKLWQTHSESNKRSTESEAALQNHFHFHLELIIELGRVGLTTSQVTVDITVENSPKMYCGGS